MAKKTTEQTTAERRAEIAQRMHVARMGDGYHILEIPAADGSPFEAWPGPFQTERAAELFRDDLIDACAAGTPGDACCSSGMFEAFEQQARVLEFLEARKGITDPRELARDLCTFQPWQRRSRSSGNGDDTIPF